jgi:glucose-6-phosphate 1-epimerase
MHLANGERGLWQGISVTYLRSTDGATAVIADHGAQLLSWCPAGAAEVFFLSKTSGYQSDEAIRGGVPVIFPQFGERGRGKRHGFARTSQWHLLSVENDRDDGAAIARLSLTGNMAATAVPTAAGGDLEYALILDVRLLGHSIHISLTIENRSSTTFQCHAALHSYLAVDDIGATTIDGLQEVSYVDQANGGISVEGQTEALRISEEIDRIYGNVSAPVWLETSTCKVEITQKGFHDVVVWNPGNDKGDQLVDMEKDGYRRFVCIEAASVLTPLIVEAGATWTGIQYFQLANPPLTSVIT